MDKLACVGQCCHFQLGSPHPARVGCRGLVHDQDAGLHLRARPHSGLLSRKIRQSRLRHHRPHGRQSDGVSVDSDDVETNPPQRRETFAAAVGCSSHRGSLLQHCFNVSLHLHRLRHRREALDGVAILRDEEFGEVPADFAVLAAF